LGQFKDLIKNKTNIQFVMQLGFNGIGLPQSMYDSFKSEMKKLDPKIDCNSNVGGICFTQTPCSELLRKTGQH